MARARRPEPTGAHIRKGGGGLGRPMVAPAAGAAANAAFEPAPDEPSAAIVGATAIPTLDLLVGQLWDQVGEGVRRRCVEVLHAAAAATGMTEPALAQSVGESEPKKLLAGLAMSAASRTAYPAKVRALGRALGEGLRAVDDASLEEHQVVLTAMADLESLHLAVLDLMLEKRYLATATGWAITDLHTASVDRLAGRAKTYHHWSADELRKARPGASGVLGALLSTLQRHGLIIAIENFTAAFDKYGKAVERAARRQARTGVKAGGPSADASLALRDLPQLWSATTFGAVVRDHFLAAGASFDRGGAEA